MMVQNKYFFIFDLHFTKKRLKNNEYNEYNIKKGIIKTLILSIKKSANLYLQWLADSEERTGSKGQAPRICFANPRLYVPRAPPRRTARDGLSVRSLLKKKRKIKNRETKIASLSLVETDGIEGASPSHLLRKSPIICPSRSAEANRARWTVGSIP
ncbi:MAG TPA: hypothetical protein DCY15_01580, partial [Ruminococcaceae bacterium]|nr:hypothetical protein [Oscillospiraceae bacterium]